MKNPNFTKTKTELAALCGVSRPTLDKFLAMEGAPLQDQKSGWPISETREFILKHTHKEAIAAGLDSEIGDLKKWDIYERARKTKIANDYKDKVLMLRTDHEAELSEMANECQLVLNAIPARLAPDLAGLPIPEIELRLQRAVDEAIEKLNNGN